MIYFIWMCIGSLLLAGCTTSTFEWNEDRTAPTGVRAIVNDSLSLQSSLRCWHKWVDHSFLFTTTDQYDGCSNEGLHLVNYRNKQSVVWQDTLDISIGIIGQLTDSIVYGGDLNSEIHIWKIGRLPVKAKIASWSGNCSESLKKNMSGTPFRMRPWEKNSLIVLGASLNSGGDTCQYAIFDSTTGVMEQARFIAANSWLSSCEDITYINNDIYCIKKSKAEKCGIDLIVNGVVTDSIVFDSCKFLDEKPVATWFGNYVELKPYYYKSDWRGQNFTTLVKVSGGSFDHSFSSIWMSNWPLAYYDSNGVIVQYDDNDF